jgi:tetratricopeptide (TPR) repeat protein
MNLRGIAFYDQGAYQDAERILNEVWTRIENGRRVGDDLTAIYLAETLKKLERFSEASTVLRKAADSFQSGNLHHHLATLLYEQGQVPEAFQIFDILRRPQFRTRIYAIGYARRLLREHRTNLMHEVCRDVVSPDLYGIPRTAEDFWHCGFAQFLLGNLELSEYDRVRGGAFSLARYEGLV